MTFTRVVYGVPSVAKGLYEALDRADGLAEVCEGLGDRGGRNLGCEISTGLEDCKGVNNASGNRVMAPGVVQSRCMSITTRAVVLEEREASCG